MKKRKISVISNDRDFLTEICESLKLNNFDAAFFYTDEIYENLHHLENTDLIIIDINKNDFTEYETIKTLKIDDKNFKDKPVIAISGYINTMEEKDYLIEKYQLIECFVKPINIYCILKSINRILNFKNSVVN